MRVYLMTDLEGVAGVKNALEWLGPGDKFYEEGRRLLTEEVNATIRGFKRAGATRIRVADGHGLKGINREILDDSAEYYRATRPNPYPFGLDDGFDVMGWVGQHAKAGASFAHLPHTGSFNVIDYRINGVSVGELEQIAICGQLYGVEPIFAAGDVALTQEAKHFHPDITTVSVKRGLDSGQTETATENEYRRANPNAEHENIALVHQKLEDGAYQALKNYSPGRRRKAWYSVPLTREIAYREHGNGHNHTVTTQYSDILSLLNDL